MKTTKLFVLAAITTGMAVSGFAQTTMTQLFKVDDGGSLAWLAGGDLTRGLTYNTNSGNVLVADRDSTFGNKVHVLDAATGAEIGTGLDNSAYSGGNHVVSKVQADSQGVVYVCNLAIATANFKVYRHADEAAPSTEAVNLASSPVRLGDSMSLTGSGTGTKILINGFTGFGGGFYVFTTVDGLTYTGASISPAGVATTNLYAKWDPNGSDYWISKLFANFEVPTVVNQFNSSDANIGSFTLGTTEAYGGFELANVSFLSGPQKVMGNTPGSYPAAATGIYGGVFSIVGANANHIFTTEDLAKAGGAVANGNGTGDVGIDATGKRVYYLYTNNSVSGWQMPNSAGVGDWNLF
jgi:hypothetical protein